MTKKALLIGLDQGTLNGAPFNDVAMLLEFMVNSMGFQERDITMITDEDEHQRPTQVSITTSLETLVRNSVAGDSVFLFYSGHSVNVMGHRSISIRLGEFITGDFLRSVANRIGAICQFTVVLDTCRAAEFFDV